MPAKSKRTEQSPSAIGVTNTVLLVTFSELERVETVNRQVLGVNIVARSEPEGIGLYRLCASKPTTASGFVGETLTFIWTRPLSKPLKDIIGAVVDIGPNTSLPATTLPESACTVIADPVGT